MEESSIRSQGRDQTVSRRLVLSDLDDVGASSVLDADVGFSYGLNLYIRTAACYGIAAQSGNLYQLPPSYGRGSS